MAFLDSIHGVIARRILLNYRIDPDVLGRVLPAGFGPKLFQGFGIGGVCMIRFRGLRPRFVPAAFGLRSENAAHRIAVEWDEDGTPREGVFIPRRDTSSWFNKTLGGRVFPGLFDRSTFTVREADGTVAVKINRHNGSEEVAFAGRLADRLPSTSVFPTLDDAANFFSLGATGYSATRQPGHYHGMELKCLQWQIDPLEIEYARSCFFSDLQRFPAGTVETDCALLMREVDHEWHSRPDLHFRPGPNCLSTRSP